MKIYWLILLVLSIASCMPNKSSFIELEPSIEKGALVYVYRPDSFSNIALSPEIIIDGNKRIKLKNDSYNYIYLQQGNHLFQLDLTERYIGNKQINIDVSKNSRYFLKVTTQLKFQKNDMYTRRFDMSIVEKDIALEEMRYSQYVGKNKVSNQPANKQGNFPVTHQETPEEDIATDEFNITKSRNPFSK